MFQTLQILTIILVAVAMATGLAHVLEFPGKMRLSRDAYLTVQPIYYPGFTVGGGIGEAGGLVATIILLILTPQGTPRFWFTLAAALGMIGMQVVFWLYTQPANKFWLRTTSVGKFGTGFFALNPAEKSGTDDDSDWKRLRNRWEYSHIVRAGFAFVSFFFLLLSLVVQD
jgi:hypothetical protein